MRKYLQSALGKIKNRYSKEGQKLHKISKMDRFKKAYINIFDHKFLIADSRSFIGQYSQIIQKEIYKFKTEKEVPLIIDCGANIGLSVKYFKSLYPNSSIIAFEPDPELFEILKFNVTEMRLKNVSLINKAVWNKNASVNFIGDKADGGHLLFSEKKDGYATEVQTVSLREYLDNPVDFLKIDVEGAETSIIRDIEDLLYNVENIFIEYHSRAKEGKSLSSILSFLEKNDLYYFIQQATIDSKNPYIKINTFQDFDNLLNIFAFKIK